MKVIKIRQNMHHFVSFPKLDPEKAWARIVEDVRREFGSRENAGAITIEEAEE